MEAEINKIESKKQIKINEARSFRRLLSIILIKLQPDLLAEKKGKGQITNIRFERGDIIIDIKIIIRKYFEKYFANNNFTSYMKWAQTTKVHSRKNRQSHYFCIY